MATSPLKDAEHDPAASQPRRNACVNAGWGRILFAQTYADTDRLLKDLRAERAEQRDIAMYVSDPHVLLAGAPTELFLDPSHTYRLNLAMYRSNNHRPAGFLIRRLIPDTDADSVDRLFKQHGMIAVEPAFLSQVTPEKPRLLTYCVAQDEQTGNILGVVMGVDHSAAFGDPDNGSSLWTLAVDPQAAHPGIGEALVRWLAEHFRGLGARYLDLSVLHDNEAAIALYEKLGFRRIPLFAVKRRNPINEPLYAGHDPAKAMNPYARIIVDEARRRGIGASAIDTSAGLFELQFGGRKVRCRESLSELTSAVAVAICDDKALTRRIVKAAGIAVPEQVEARNSRKLVEMLDRHGSLVVKPACGEQGQGVAVRLEDIGEIRKAVLRARVHSPRVLVESFHEGDDLRLIVIGFQLVAAAVRRPPAVVGDGQSCIHRLIEQQSRRRSAATGGESQIPIDAETERCIRRAGYELDDVLPKGRSIVVRLTANLHTGGTVHDVTHQLHPSLAEAAIRAARAINIPVVGIDFITPDPAGPDYVFIEANERPGLANHEPQPTAQRFIDFLFPLSMPGPKAGVHYQTTALG